MTIKDLEIGEHYNFRNQPERLKYRGIGTGGSYGWHQFSKVGKQEIWCEVLEEELHMLEITEND